MFGSRRTCLSVALGLVMCCGLATSAIADLSFEAITNPIEANSWLQGFELQSDRAFSYVGLLLGPLKGDVGSGFKENAWFFDDPSNPFDDPNDSEFQQRAVFNLPGLVSWTSAAAAPGESPVTDLTWWSHFTGDEADQDFTLTLFAFNSGYDWQGATARWDGTDWTFGFHTRDIEWQTFRDAGGVASVIPAPSAVALGLLGLGIVGLIRRRFA